MLKLIGATLIIAASTYGGLVVARSYHERPKQLRYLQQGLQMLETEIAYSSRPLHIAMDLIGKRIPGIIGQLFQEMGNNLRTLDGESTFECWQRAIQTTIPKTSLKAQDQQILLQYGHTLGMTDKNDQIKHIQLTVQQLVAEEQLARDDQKIYEKLSKNLGVLLGLLIVILMY
ncbi:stage III sporulation protein SpoIIIAB [Tepidibacillus fermentans]|uniref:Stage III sporulation protein AB n=1 Tax=Tepidibacillus fermentans TaxID=1281767 RepID=A0A4R3KK02_9BACI|nr:stage III sporulation protein SpoIIIAB [Tepidibacillus fermentans]TCS84024.1 stage III sporulation protein AB [Tepidibacillus fermentans]